MAGKRPRRLMNPQFWRHRIVPFEPISWVFDEISLHFSNLVGWNINNFVNVTKLMWIKRRVKIYDVCIQLYIVNSISYKHYKWMNKNYKHKGKNRTLFHRWISYSVLDSRSGVHLDHVVDTMLEKGYWIQELQAIWSSEELQTYLEKIGYNDVNLL